MGRLGAVAEGGEGLAGNGAKRMVVTSDSSPVQTHRNAVLAPCLIAVDGSAVGCLGGGSGGGARDSGLNDCSVERKNGHHSPSDEVEQATGDEEVEKTHSEA